MHGTPDKNAALWVDQGVDGLCLPAAMSELVAEHQGSDTGTLLPQVVSTGVSDGYLESRGGRVLRDEHVGGRVRPDRVRRPCEPLQRQRERAREVLDSGRLAIVSVDSDELPAWGRTDPLDGTSYDDGASHAVVVTGVDTGTGTVYLNDSGLSEGGREERLTVAEFTDAWADSNYQVIAGQFPSPTGQGWGPPRPRAACGCCWHWHYGGRRRRPRCHTGFDRR